MVTLSCRRSIRSVIFVYYVLNNVKYSDLYLINRLKLNVPKIALRIKNFNLFNVSAASCSPLQNMLNICNYVIQKCDIDIFNTNVRNIKYKMLSVLGGVM